MPCSLQHEFIASFIHVLLWWMWMEIYKPEPGRKCTPKILSSNQTSEAITFSKLFYETVCVLHINSYSWKYIHSLCFRFCPARGESKRHEFVCDGDSTTKHTGKVGMWCCHRLLYLHWSVKEAWQAFSSGEMLLQTRKVALNNVGQCCYAIIEFYDKPTAECNKYWKGLSQRNKYIAKLIILCCTALALCTAVECGVWKRRCNW